MTPFFDNPWPGLFSNNVLESELGMVAAVQKKHLATKIMLHDNPVVLACASYRMWKENPSQRWVNFESVIVQQQDRDQAASLKQYYNGRFAQITFDMLKAKTGTDITPFKKKLYLLVLDQLDVTIEEIGLLHRLPYLYHEDLALDQIIDSTESATVPTVWPSTHNGTFTLIKKVLKSRSAGEFNQYWFSKDHTSQAYMLSIKTDNMLGNMFDQLTKQPVRAQSLVKHALTKHGSTHQHFQMKSFELVAHE